MKKNSGQAEPFRFYFSRAATLSWLYVVSYLDCMCQDGWFKINRTQNGFLMNGNLKKSIADG
jgi:hypothetical protein